MVGCAGHFVSCFPPTSTDADSLVRSLVLPSIMRATVGIVAVGAKRYIDWAQALHRWETPNGGTSKSNLDPRYMALFVWTLIIWISWNPLIDNHPKNGAGAKSLAAISLIGKLLFGIYLCSAVLLFEKFSIQYIAGKFHERSYAGTYVQSSILMTAISRIFICQSVLPTKSSGSGHW